MLTHSKLYRYLLLPMLCLLMAVAVLACQGGPWREKLTLLQLADFYLFDSQSQRQLAQEYLTDDSVLPQAVKWLRRAAGQGDAAAHYQLAHLYYQHPQLTDDAAQFLAISTRELELAADAGMAKAQFELAGILLKRDALDSRVRALDYLQKAAAQQHLQAQLLLGKTYCMDSALQDPNRGQQYLQQAATNGDKEAPMLLGLMLLQGQCGPVAVSDGIHWLEQAAAAANPQAMELLGNFYQQGLHVRQDVAKAAGYYYRSLQGDGLYRLGRLLQQQPSLKDQLQQQWPEGFMTGQSLSQSVALCFYAASRSGHPKAAFAYGVTQWQAGDTQAALGSFMAAKDAGYPQVAASQGDADGQADLASIHTMGLDGFFGLTP